MSLSVALGNPSSPAKVKGFVYAPRPRCKNTKKKKKSTRLITCAAISKHEELLAPDLNRCPLGK